MRSSVKLPEPHARQPLRSCVGLGQKYRGALSCSGPPTYVARSEWITVCGIFTTALQRRRRSAKLKASFHVLASTAASSDDATAVISDRPALRFEIGARVWCNVGDWALGTVVKHWYHEPGQPLENVAPYQVKLDGHVSSCTKQGKGMTIFAPFDDDKCIRAAQGIDAYGKIPVTILTGFLGAGKTTLLNYILREQHGKRYAVIENEVGNVAIDEMLVDDTVGRQSTMESIRVLDNGCLCCTLRDDLVGAITGIVDTVQKRIDEGIPEAMIDGILIETTGIADPGPVCKTFDLNPLMKRHCKIDGILTVVDSVHFLTQLRRERPDGAVNESAQQVAFADKVLLNKVDAVDPMTFAETLETIRSINPIVPIRKCSIGKRPNEVPLEDLIGIDSFDSATRMLMQEAEGSIMPQTCSGTRLTYFDSSCCDSGDKEKDCSDPNCEDPSQTKSQILNKQTDIGTMLLEMVDTPLDAQSFKYFLRDLLKERSADLYRYKGILAIRSKSLIVRYVLQGVHDMAEITFSSEWPAERPVKTQIVIIGRNLDTESWRQTFAECESR